MYVLVYYVGTIWLISQLDVAFWCLYKKHINYSDKDRHVDFLSDSSQFHSVFGHQYCWRFDSLSKWNCSKTGFYGDQAMHTSPIDNAEGEHPTSNTNTLVYSYIHKSAYTKYLLLGKITFVSFTSSCCNGNESRYCWQSHGQTVSQNLHSETWKC